MNRAYYFQEVDDRKYTRGARLMMILSMSAVAWVGIIGLITELA